MNGLRKYCCLEIALILLLIGAIFARKPRRTVVRNPIYLDMTKEDLRVHLEREDFARARRKIIPDEKFKPKGMPENRLVEGDIDGFTHEEYKKWIFHLNEIWTLKQTHGDKFQSSVTADLDKRWSNGTIPYYLSSRYEVDARTKIAQTIQLFHKKTCVKFVPRFEEKDFIYIQPKQDYICSSLIGKNGGEQLVSLGKGCFGLATVFHELMHVLGFYHEQSRNDRDEFIRIVWRNISPNDTINFAKYPLHMIDHLRTTYDYCSVMHYGAKYFSTNGQGITHKLDEQFVKHEMSEFSMEWNPNVELSSAYTLIPLKPFGPCLIIGQTIGPSEVDLERINRLYNCPGYEGKGEKEKPTGRPDGGRTTTTTPAPPPYATTPPVGPVFTPFPGPGFYTTPTYPGPGLGEWWPPYGPGVGPGIHPGVGPGSLVGPGGGFGQEFGPGGPYNPDYGAGDDSVRPHEGLCEPCHGCTGCRGCAGCRDCPDCPKCSPCLPLVEDDSCPTCKSCPRCAKCPKNGCQKCKACPACPCDKLGRYYDEDGNLVPGQGGAIRRGAPFSRRRLHQPTHQVGYVPWFSFNKDESNNNGDNRRRNNRRRGRNGSRRRSSKRD